MMEKWPVLKDGDAINIKTTFGDGGVAEEQIQAVPTAGRRMPWHAELRWLFSSYLIWWAMSLVMREATPELLTSFAQVAGNFKNDPRYDTVTMRAKRPNS